MWSLFFEGQTLVDETKWSQARVLQDRMTTHGFEYLVAGAGTVDIEVYTSISGEVWISNGVKAAGIGSGSGPGSNGSDIIPLRLKTGDLIKFKAVATGTITLSIWFTQK